MKNSEDEDLYNKLEKKFAQTHVDMKVEYYETDCHAQYLTSILKYGSCYPCFDLLVSMESLELIEKLMNEF